jgi:hypothetical protein
MSVFNHIHSHSYTYIVNLYLQYGDILDIVTVDMVHTDELIQALSNDVPIWCMKLYMTCEIVQYLQTATVVIMSLQYLSIPKDRVV